MLDRQNLMSSCEAPTFKRVGGGKNVSVNGILQPNACENWIVPTYIVKDCSYIIMTFERSSGVIIHYSLEQCKLAIHLAEHNFGPFGQTFFVIVLFEPESKALFRVLFLSLSLHICIFYFVITKDLYF
jgi:hypothetical protein